MEEARKRAHDHLLLIERQAIDQANDLAKCDRGLVVALRDTLLIDLFFRGKRTGIALIGTNLSIEDLVEQIGDLGIVLVEDPTLEAQEQSEVVAQRFGNVDLGELVVRLGVRADALFDAPNDGRRHALRRRLRYGLVTGVLSHVASLFVTDTC